MKDYSFIFIFFEKEIEVERQRQTGRDVSSNSSLPKCPLKTELENSAAKSQALYLDLRLG